MRIIVNTGKGGVGKTTISALTALNISQKHKTLIMSTDFAHSLSDCFEIKLNNRPTRINNNLYALEINPTEESKKAWENLHSYIKEIITKNTMTDIQMDELLLLPGFDDIFALLRILDEYEKNQYEVIVVDSGPSGETLSLLSMGEKFQNLADSLIPLVKRVNKIIGSFVEKNTQVKKPRDIVFDEFIFLSKRLYSLQKILQDKSITTIRLVTRPNTVIINETFRTYSLLNIYGFFVDSIFINNIYPKEISDSLYGNLLYEQDQNIKKIEDFFKNQKLFYTEMQDTEIIGLNKLDFFSKVVFNNEDLSQNYANYLSYHIDDFKGTKIITIDVPFIKNARIDVKKIENDIEIGYLNYKRRFKLPDNLSNREITRYELIDKKLKIMMDY